MGILMASLEHYQREGDSDGAALLGYIWEEVSTQMAMKSGASPPALPTREETERERQKEKEIEDAKFRASGYLRELLSSPAGDMSALTALTIQMMGAGKIDGIFDEVLEEYIKANRAAGYENKAKVCRQMDTWIHRWMDSNRRRIVPIWRKYALDYADMCVYVYIFVVCKEDLCVYVYIFVVCKEAGR